MVQRCVLLSDGAAPTEAIYYLAASEALRRAGLALERIDTRARGGRRPGPRLFARRLAGRTVIVCRSLADDWIAWLEARRETLNGLVYLIDDDLGAAAASPQLPEGYRARMARAAERQPRLLALADTVVATSTALQERLSPLHPDVRLLTPSLVAPIPGTPHFDHRRWRAGFHGTRAHASDLAAIVPALQRLLGEGPQLDCEVLLGRATPAALRGCCRVRRPKPWRRYRRYLGKPRLHIGLVPLMAGPFNECKSWVKFLETASMGGVGVFSARRPYTEIIEHGVDGLLVDDDPDQWHRALRWLLDKPDAARTIADRGARKAAAVGDPARAAQFWRALL